MGDIEGAPFALGQRRRLRLALPHLQQVRLAVLCGQRHRLSDLLRAALDPNDLDAGRARHVARELAEPGAEIDDPLALAELRRHEAALVQEPIHHAEALLFGRVSAMHIVRGRHLPPPRMTQTPPTIHPPRTKARIPRRSPRPWRPRGWDWLRGSRARPPRGLRLQADSYFYLLDRALEPAPLPPAPACDGLPPLTAARLVGSVAHRHCFGDTALNSQVAMS